MPEKGMPAMVLAQKVTPKTCSSADAGDRRGWSDGVSEFRRQETLLKTGALQDAIFNSANFSSIATDEKGVIQIFNVGAERMLGYAAADVINRITPADISDPQEVIARAEALSVELATPITPGFEALVFKASRGIEDIYELTYIRKDGSHFPAVVSVTALRDAQNLIIGYLLIGTDNTARKQVEAEQKLLDQRLRDQQFYTRSLIESNIDALMTTDPRGIITDVNKQTEALTGCTRDELIGAPFKDYFTEPAKAEAGIKLVLSEKKVTNYELTARARDGKETVVSYNATTFYDRDRNLQGVFVAARDVTERQGVDRILQEKNIELEHASRMKSEFLATMSHELRTPLNGLLGMLELLGLSGLDGEQRATLEVARESGRGLVRIIDDVLDNAKIEAGKLEIRVEPVSIATLLHQVLNSYHAVASAKDLTLKQTVDPRISLSLLADPLRVLQILNNLVSNALKFTAEGGVEIQAALLGRADGADTICLSVTDTGIGIEPEAQQRLFQPFEQAGAGTARVYGGTGLGLSISRRLAEMMGGTIQVKSVPREGTTMGVTLTLQISDAAPAELESPARPILAPILVAGPPGTGPLVLAVDDHPTNRELLARQIAALGPRVQTAADGREGLALWQAGGIAVVVTDCNMPVMDGYALARAIREIEAKEGRSRTPIIAWTANVLPGTAARCHAAGMDHILTKPAELAVLKETLSKCLPSAATATAATDGVADAQSGVASLVPLDHAQLNRIAATAAEREDILLDFMTQTRSDLAGLHVAQTGHDLPACARIAHRMKGSSRMVGALDLAAACETLERSERQGTPDATAIDRALERLEAHLAKPPARDEGRNARS
jgi:PAS domain S-box-containing protein